MARRNKRSLAILSIFLTAHLNAGPHRGVLLQTVSGAPLAGFADAGNFALAKHSTSQANWTFNTNADLLVGNLGVCVFAVDNDGDGTDTNDFTTFVDQAGNTWTVDGENEVDPGAGAAGAAVASGWTLATFNLVSGSSATINFGAAKIAKAVSCEKYTVGNGVTISTFGVIQKEDSAGGVGSLTLGSLSSAEYLFLRTIGTEGRVTSILTPTTNWSVFTSTGHDSGADSSSMGIAAEWHIATATTDTSSPTMTNAAALDRASAMIAIGHTP